MADDMEEFLDAEHPVERAARHAIEGRMQFATVEALQSLTVAVKEVAVKQESTDRKVDEMKGWLMGTVSAEGTPTPGILQTVALLGRAWKWALGLLATTAAASVANAAHTWFGGGR